MYKTFKLSLKGRLGLIKLLLCSLDRFVTVSVYQVHWHREEPHTAKEHHKDPPYEGEERHGVNRHGNWKGIGYCDGDRIFVLLARLLSRPKLWVRPVIQGHILYQQQTLVHRLLSSPVVLGYSLCWAIRTRWRRRLRNQQYSSLCKTAHFRVFSSIHCQAMTFVSVLTAVFDSSVS